MVDHAAPAQSHRPMKAAKLDAAFTALADPRRRALIRALVGQPRRAGELAKHVRMSAPALSRHLRVLRRAGLVTEGGIDEDARVRMYRLAPNALAPARAWLDEVEQFWTEQLDAFKAHAEAALAHPRTTRRGRVG